MTSVISTLKGDFVGGGIHTHFHSDFVYDDIYLDTDNVELYQKGYSLRLRRRDQGTTAHEYLLQLKREKLTNEADRLEIDYLIDDNTSVDIPGKPEHPLTKYLDDIFELMQEQFPGHSALDISHSKFTSAKTAIVKWLATDKKLGGFPRLRSRR